MGLRRINVELLVGTHEAAKIIGLSDARISQLLKEDPTFPQPVHRVQATPLWMAPELEHWARTRVKKPQGRKPRIARGFVDVSASQLLPGDQPGGQVRTGDEGQPG